MRSVFQWAMGLFLVGAGAAVAEPGRVIILGFDGADPVLATEMMDRGELPHLAKLRETGSFQPLGSSNPPQSPTAWSSFATSKGPLNHGIYDFLRRTPASYMPGVGFGRTEVAKLGADGSVATPPRYVSNRKGDSFWKIASDQGRKVKALVVPFAYPAEDLGQECLQLCGLDVPDIRGTQSTYFAIGEAFAKEEAVAGGVRLPVQFVNNQATVLVPGLRVPGGRELVRAPLGLQVDRAAKAVTITLDGQTATLREGEWSQWVEWRFTVTPKYTVQAVSRFHVMSAGDQVRLYMTCLQIHPKEPMMPIGSPGYSAALVGRYGLFKTIGWEFDTKALQQGDMTEEMFLEDVERTLAWTKRLTLDEIDAGGFDLLVSATTSTDRVSHMFWGYRDPKHPLYTPELHAKYGMAVENSYKKMDEFVGEVVAKLKPDDLLMVMSDHGFHSFRTEFSVNTWLAQNGYLAIKGQADPATAFTDTKYLEAFDWTKTRAYALGLGMIFLNLKGREGQGTVDPAAAPALIEEIKGKLLALTDPQTGEKVFSAIYTNVDPKGVAVEDAPDLQLGYAEGYQTAKASAAGAAPKDLFAPNRDKWSGEHASSDLAITPGILFSNQKLKAGATLVDLGVTALSRLGATVPADLEGKSLLE